MQLSPLAQDIRNLANRLEQLSEEHESESSVDIQVQEAPEEDPNKLDSGELVRLNIALRPLVSDNMQGRFRQLLSKLVDGKPISLVEMKMLSVVFASMADIIATDTNLITRLRNDIRVFVDHEHEQPKTESIDQIVSLADFDEVK